MLTPRVFVGRERKRSSIEGKDEERTSSIEDRGLRPGDDYRLPAASARHVAQALRMRVGDELALFDGTGGEYEARLVRIERDDVVVRIGSHVAIERESAAPVTLAQAVIANDMMDLVVRKGVELGVAAIAPFYAARSQRLPREREARRLAHWRSIAVAACEQCGRNRVPDVLSIVDFDACVRGGPDDVVIVLNAEAPASLAERGRNALPTRVVVGPEGGLTAEEVARAESHGALSAHLGNRVLRAETAALAALAIVGAIVDDAR